MRGLIPLDDSIGGGLHIPRRLRRRVKQHPYEITIDQDFTAVITACAARSDNRTDTWINKDIRQLYIANPADHQGAVTSPMVGTVYTAPEPGAAEFVTEGDMVKAGQTLFIVEAMKVMNPITAPAAGKVTKIFVQNAQPIEFGEALAIIE